ncbi:MAG TPA: hypothetical protein VLK82_06885, partial [Candidatus Tectomicrobia bacterium]|nr:hypothetical protein [Candidatus Tectomicrobia bacterium]
MGLRYLKPWGTRVPEDTARAPGIGWIAGKGLLDLTEVLRLEVFDPIADGLRVLGGLLLGQIDT